MRLNMVHSALWPKASAFHCGSTTIACFGRPGSLCSGAGNQRAFTRSFSGYGVRSGDVNRKNCARGNSSVLGLLAKRRVLGQRLGPHVGREQLRMPLLKPEIGGPLVSKELVAVPDQELVDARHGRFGRGISPPIRIQQLGGSQLVRLEKGRDPLETPLQRTHHSIFIPRCQPCFPPVHPTRVRFSQHWSIYSLSAHDSTTCPGNAGARELPERLSLDLETCRFRFP